MSARPAMEPWPLVAWFLMLTSLADWLKTVRARDFTKKDIIFLHPSSKYLNIDIVYDSRKKKFTFGGKEDE